MNIEKEIIEKVIEERPKTPEELSRIKREVVKKYRSPFPDNATLLEFYHNSGGRDESVISVLRTNPVRSLSGVVNVSVLTKPFPCPGNCIYCPFQEGAPQSYLDNEPAVMRAISNEYDPKKQIRSRLDTLRRTGHPTDKLEIRIVGGTWSFYPLKYQKEFIKDCFDACNEEESATLQEAQRKNEKKEHRIICLSVETRPDFITKKEIKRLRVMGVTMVELGVQSLFDEVLRYNQRGHDTDRTRRATKLLKDAGFKVCHQVMLNLPGSDPQKDTETFRLLFSDPSFRPDFLKIYPCSVMREAPLYDLWKEGKYQPFEDEELIRIIKEVKRDIIPYYTRIQRLFRDIPAQSIAGGSKLSNLREKISEEAKKEGWRCKCIRCREVRGDYDPREGIRLFREDYEASDGKEIFLSMENEKRNKLFAILRLRMTEDPVFPVLDDSGIIREIHTYGQQSRIKRELKPSPQHKGIGKRLVREAERIAKEEFGKKRVSVISGVGAREYWRSLGYSLKDTYMIKRLIP